MQSQLHLSYFNIVLQQTRSSAQATAQQRDREGGRYREIEGGRAHTGSLTSWWGAEDQGHQSGRISADSPSNPTMGVWSRSVSPPNERPWHAHIHTQFDPSGPAGKENLPYLLHPSSSSIPIPNSTNSSQRWLTISSGHVSPHKYIKCKKMFISSLIITYHYINKHEKCNILKV